MSPKVSILIPCYNAEQWIAQAIQSALDQTYSNKEVIVVDDGSSDRSLEIIQTFGDAITWEAQSNQGGNNARNRLLNLSSGTWIQYLDADDYLLPTKIEEQVQYLMNVPSADLVYSPSILEHWNNGQVWQEILPIPQPHDPWVLLARWYLPQTNSPLWRKQAILDVSGWKSSQPCCQEHELYFRLLKTGKVFAYCESAKSVYRQWSNTTVCKKDIRQTWLMRLAIETELEEYLLSTSQMTAPRHWAINQARFETARMIWLVDKAWAAQIANQIKASDSAFLPYGDAAPQSYRLLFQLLGFQITEYLAAAIRFPKNLRHTFLRLEQKA